MQQGHERSGRGRKRMQVQPSAMPGGLRPEWGVVNPDTDVGGCNIRAQQEVTRSDGSGKTQTRQVPLPNRQFAEGIQRPRKRGDGG